MHHLVVAFNSHFLICRPDRRPNLRRVLVHRAFLCRIYRSDCATAFPHKSSRIGKAIPRMSAAGSDQSKDNSQEFVQNFFWYRRSEQIGFRCGFLCLIFLIEFLLPYIFHRHFIWIYNIFSSKRWTPFTNENYNRKNDILINLKRTLLNEIILEGSYFQKWVVAVAANQPLFSWFLHSNRCKSSRETCRVPSSFRSRFVFHFLLFSRIK